MGNQQNIDGSMLQFHVWHFICVTLPVLYFDADISTLYTDEADVAATAASHFVPRAMSAEDVFGVHIKKSVFL